MRSARSDNLQLGKLEIIFLDISVLWPDCPLPEVRDDQDPPEGGPRSDERDLPPLLRPAARQPPGLELPALQGLQDEAREGVGGPTPRTGSRPFLPRQQ